MNENNLTLESYELHLDDSKIDAILLAEVIKNFSELTKLIAETGDIKVKVFISSFKKGSFAIDFVNIIENAGIVLTALSSVITVVTGIFKIKNFLGKKYPKKIEHNGSKINIENQNNKHLIIDDKTIVYFNNPEIDKYISIINSNIYLNNPNSGYSIVTKDSVDEYTPKDIDNMKIPLDITENLCKTVVDAILLIKKPDLIGNSMWEFMYDNHSIKATIRDKDWLNKVHKGELGIHSGDKLIVSLEIECLTNYKKVLLEETVKYAVLKVNDIQHGNDPFGQMSLY